LTVPVSIRIPEIKITAPVRSDKNFQGRREDSEYRADEAENDDQQSSFLNISRFTI
jgi:hypothetical protein